jgi:hypothetical protein
MEDKVKKKRKYKYQYKPNARIQAYLDKEIVMDETTAYIGKMWHHSPKLRALARQYDRQTYLKELTQDIKPQE